MMDDDQLTAARLRRALDREVAKHQLAPGAWPRLERRLRRQPRRRAAIAVVCAVIIAAAAVVAPYLWHRRRVRLPAIRAHSPGRTSSSPPAPT